MDSEDETMTYLKLFNDNSGNYSIQNSYELQDCLSVEPIFTEIETETWSSECFPILLNTSFTNENSNTKCVADVIMTEKVQKTTDQGDMIGHIMITHSSNNEENKVCQKNKISVSPDTTQTIILPQDSSLQSDFKIFNFSSISQQGKQKKCLLLFTNGSTYEISYSSDKLIDPIKLQDLNEESKSFNNTNESTKENKIQFSQVIATNENIQQMEGREIPSNLEYSKESKIDDHSHLNEFYSILTAIKCKVCSYMCENTLEITDHLRRFHGDLIKSKDAADKENNGGKHKQKMKSLLNTNSLLGKNSSIFLCSICKNIFTTKELLKEHVKHVDNGNVEALDSG